VSTGNVCGRHVGCLHARDTRSRDTIDHAAPEVERQLPPEPLQRREDGRGLEGHQTASCFSDCISNDDELITIIAINIIVATAVD